MRRRYESVGGLVAPGAIVRPVGELAGPKFLTRAAYALYRRERKWLGGTRGAVDRAVADGRVRMSPDGLVDVAASNAAWPGEINRPVPVPAAGLLKSRETDAKFKAQLRRLEYEKRVGDLVTAKDVEARAFTRARQVRDAVLSVADRLAPELAAETDLLKVQTLLRTELTNALASLATEFEKSSEEKFVPPVIRKRGRPRKAA